MNLAREVRFLALVNLLIGATWLLSGPSRTRSEVYEPAKMLLEWQSVYPMRVYGAIACGIGLLTALASARAYAGLLTASLTAGVAYWTWWGLMFAIGAVTAGSTGIVVWLILAFVRRHWILFPTRHR
jgi:hypothetical protein